MVADLTIESCKCNGKANLKFKEGWWGALCSKCNLFKSVKSSEYSLNKEGE